MLRAMAGDRSRERHATSSKPGMTIATTIATLESRTRAHAMVAAATHPMRRTDGSCAHHTQVAIIATPAVMDND